jgi:hypothetical protein
VNARNFTAGESEDHPFGLIADGGIGKTSDVNACLRQTPVFAAKTENSQNALQIALQKALQTDPTALSAAISSLTAEQRAEILKALGVQG